MTPIEQLAEAEATVARLKAQIAAAPCREVGHDWKSIGGRNCGCEGHGDCSVPVNVCQKCGDCDYGENAEAEETIRQCREERA